MRFAVFSLVLLTGCGPTPSPHAVSSPYSSDLEQQVEDCGQTADLNLKIGGCTALIRSGELTGEYLAPAYSLRGAAYIALGEPTRAIEDYDQAIRLYPGRASLYFARAEAYIALGEYARVIGDMDQTILLDPKYAKDALVYSIRGVAYRHTGEYARAIEDFDQAIRLNPVDASAYVGRGLTHADLGEYALGIKDLNHAIRLNPEHSNAYFSRGHAYNDLGESDRATRDWEHGIAIGGAPQILWWQGHLKILGHYSGAINGVYDPETKVALRACARDPAC